MLSSRGRKNIQRIPERPKLNRFFSFFSAAFRAGTEPNKQTLKTLRPVNDRYTSVAIPKRATAGRFFVKPIIQMIGPFKHQEPPFGSHPVSTKSYRPRKNRLDGCQSRLVQPPAAACPGSKLGKRNMRTWGFQSGKQSGNSKQANKAGRSRTKCHRTLSFQFLFVNEQTKITQRERGNHANSPKGPKALPESIQWAVLKTGNPAKFGMSQTRVLCLGESRNGLS